MPDHTVHVTSSGSVLFNSSTPIAGFQMDLDGATIISAGGGMADEAGFMISSSATTFLGFSLDGSTIEGCGIMVELELDGEATGLSGIVISDSNGEIILTEFYDGSNTDEGPFCGDGVCNGDENVLSCSEDCNGGGAWDGDACTMPVNTVHLNTEGLILYNTNSPIAGFQIDVDGGATISSAGGGEAGAAGFMISASENRVLGFSLTGATFEGCGIMVELELEGDAAGLSGIVISDGDGIDLEFEYFDGTFDPEIEGCTNGLACNYNEDATVDDGSCEFETDECGLCGGDNSTCTDCAGVPNGDSELDICNVCDGPGATIECEDGTFVCDDSGCETQVSLSFGNIANGVFEVVMLNDLPVAGFQFDIDGITILDALGGSSEESEFMITFSATTIIGFSLTGATIPIGEAVLVNVSYIGDGETCLENIVFSDTNGNAINSEVGDCVTINDPECPNGYDECDVCGGDNTSCSDCSGVPNGEALIDECGVCGGDNSTCVDCASVPNGNAELDECGVCDGDNSTCTDCAGVINGDAVIDECGICNGDGTSCAVYIEETIITTVEETELVDLDAFADEFELYIESQLLLPEGSVEVTNIIIESRDNLNITVEFTITLTEEELSETNFTSSDDIADAWDDVSDEITTNGLLFIYGCTDITACNYDLDVNATIDDGSCLQFDCTYDPNDDLTWENACGGSTIYGECGVCGGNSCFNQDCSAWPSESFDCTGHNLADLEFLQAFVDSSNLSIDPLNFGVQAWGDNGRLVSLSISDLFDDTNSEDTIRIPENIGNLDSLNTLIIRTNTQITGSIPEGIGNLTQLTELTLEKNSLIGELPDTLSNLLNLTKLKLKDNQFIGVIPVSLCNLDSTINWSSSSNFTIKDNYLCPPYPDCMVEYIDYGDQCGRFVSDNESIEVPEACDSCELRGCIDNDACNYFNLCNEYDCVDDGTCEMPPENYDCYDNCIAALDCAGDCGGTAIVDVCGNCEGTCIMTNTNYFGIDVSDFIVCSESENNIIEAGCDGVCGSPYKADACGNCSGDCSYINSETEEPYEDGMMVCSENAGLVKSYTNSFYVDFLSRCDGYELGLNCGEIFENALSGDIILLPDCAGVCGGEAIIDECGDCGGDNTCLSLRELLIPEEYSIYNIYPNPFNPVTNISYGLPENVYVKILIFDIYGNLVQTLINSYQTAGYHSLEWNASYHSSGMYFVKILAGSSAGSEISFSKTQKLMLIK